MMTYYELKEMVKSTFLGSMLYRLHYSIDKLKEKKAIKRYSNSPSAEKMRKLKGSAKRERCFVIGNGPSLRLEDLEMLSNEDTFASNRIYEVFDKCAWRPTYYCVQDDALVFRIADNINNWLDEFKSIFLNKTIEGKLPEPLGSSDKMTYVYFAWRSGRIYDVDFSEDCAEYFAASMTVTYMMIQMAVYMGYKEIYLIGVDNSYVVDKNKKPTAASYPDFFSHDDVRLESDHEPHTDKTEQAYMKAKEVCDSKNIKIYNATRGGKLEVFERKNFDDIIGG